MTSTADTTGSSGTIGSLLGRCLVALGARRAFASVANVGPIGSTGPVRTDLGLDLTLVGDPTLAALLAAADGRIGPGPGVAVLDGQRVLLTSAPGVPAEVITVNDPAFLPGALAGWTLGLVHAAVEYVLDLDLDAHGPARARADGARRHRRRAADAFTDPGRLPAPDPGRPGRRPVGPRRRTAGTGRPDRRRGGQHLGCEGRVPVGRARTTSAPSACRPATSIWSGSTTPSSSSPTGVDLLESPTERWAGSAQVLEVEPWQLSSLALRWPEPESVPEPPELYRQLSAALADRLHQR